MSNVVFHLFVLKVRIQTAWVNMFILNVFRSQYLSVCFCMSLHYVKYQHTLLPSWQKVRISLHESRHLHFPQRAAPRAGKEAGFPLWTFSPLRDEILLPVVLSGFLVFNLSSHTEQNESLESLVFRWQTFPRSLQIAPAVKVWPPFRPFSRNFPWSLEFLTSFLLLQGKVSLPWNVPEESSPVVTPLWLQTCHKRARYQFSQKQARGGWSSVSFLQKCKKLFTFSLYESWWAWLSTSPLASPPLPLPPRGMYGSVQVIPGNIPTWLDLIKSLSCRKQSQWILLLLVMRIMLHA